MHINGIILSRGFIVPKGGKMGQKEDIVKKIKDLQKQVLEAKDEATAEELAEYLVLVEEFKVSLTMATKEIIKNRKEGGND